MLGLVGKHLLAHEDNKNYCTVNPETTERINLQPWYVTVTTEATKSSPAKTLVWRPANEEDFKVFLKLQGNTKDPLVGELPTHIATKKTELLKDAIANFEKKTPQAAK